MNWLRYAIAGVVLVAAGRTLAHHRPRSAPANANAGAASVEETMEAEAMARAHSEVSSGEYDMQG